MKKMHTCLKLFSSFFKIGLFTFGGGYAMISLLENEFVERKKWLTHDEFMNLVVIAESTPGPIAINSATYIGYKAAGTAGSFYATLGVCIPSFVIIYIISKFLDAFLSFSVVAAAFRGIQACVVYLILSAGMKMFKKMKKNLLSKTLTAASFLSLVFTTLLAAKFSTIYYILIGGVVGLLAYLLKKRKKEAESV